VLSLKPEAIIDLKMPNLLMVNMSIDQYCTNKIMDFKTLQLKLYRILNLHINVINLIVWFQIRMQRKIDRTQNR